MKNKIQSKTYPQGTRTIWRYLSAFILLFTFAIGQMWADEIFGFTCTSSTTAVSNTGYTATGGTATLSGSAMSTGGSNEMTVGTQTFYKFNSSSQWTFALSSGKFAVGDVISFTCASNASSDKSGKGVKINNSIAVTGDFPKGETNTISYTVVASDGVAGQSSFYIKRNDSDIKFGTVSVTRTATGPVDPTITFNNGAYTVGDEVLDLSSLFTSNSAGAVTYSVKTDGGTSASISGTSFSASAAGTAVVTASQAAETGKYNAKAVDANIVVSAAPSATTPSFTSPASEPAVAEYSVGDAISALEVVAAGYPAPTLQWYSNSSKSTEGATLITGAESASYTPSNAAVSDLYFYCVATNASGTAQSEYFHVTVAAVSYCAELNPATSGDEPVLGTVIAMQTGSYGGSIKVVGRKQSGSFAYTANGLTFNKGGVDSVRVTLNHLIKKDTKIYVTVNNQDGSKDQGFYLQNLSKTKKADMHRQNGSTGDTTYVYTADNGDGLVGVNEFIIARGSSSAALKSLKVSNCGAELHALTSAIDPVAAEGKATITLSKNLVAAGATATATYSAIDAAYDFDEWVVSGATIDDAKANPVTITMGSTAATITLKLKDASVKHTVTYYDGEAIAANKLGEELIEHNDHPTGAALAPRKLGYTFGGWSTTEGGAAATLSDINVTEDMPLYAVWNAVNCATKSGTIYTMSIVVAPLANCTITSTTGTHDLYQYEGVSGGEALLGNKGTSNNCILQTNKKILLKDDNSYIKLDFDCPLKEGDKIVYSVESNNPVVSTGNSKPSTPLATLDRSKTEFVIPAESGLIDAQTIYIWKGGGNTTVTYINIVRPAKYAVTFNMHDHGDAVDPQYIVEGGKVTEPATASITGWDFGGWYKESTFENEWNFATDVVNAATELHAKWTEHVASNDATLSSLTYQLGSAAPIAIALEDGVYDYAVELPMGTAVNPVVAAVKNDPNSKNLTIVQPNLASDQAATVSLTAEDNITTQEYTITFSVATSKDIELVWDKTKKRCDDTTPTANVKSDDASVSAYINKITFTGGGAEGSSLNVGNTAGNMFTLSAKAGYAFQAMSFFGKIQDATCEYSLNGGAWTELASTKTDGDKCYSDVFSAAEVHEFRLRSTGTSGVWIRNMQLTMIEACTPITLAWDEEPVEFEVGKSGYAIAATANNAGEVAYSSADGDIIAVNASTGVLTVNALGSVALKAATAEGDGTAYCANGGNPVEISKVVNTYYLVQFDAQNETSVDEVKYYSGDAAIAQPAEPSYAGFDFQGWFDAATGGNPIVWPLTPAASMTVYAQWVAQCDGPTITVQPASANYLTGRTAAALVCEATAGAAGELTYTWYSCDDAIRTNPVELAGAPTPSTAAAGTFYYYCAVTEAGCDVVRNSDVATITVADKDGICIIKVATTGGTNKTVTGLYAEDGVVNIAGDKKFGGSGQYIGMMLQEGKTFDEGDIINVHTTTAAGQGTIAIYSNSGKTATQVYDFATMGVAGNNKFALPAAVEDMSTLYVCRTDADNWNGYVDYIEVTRACAPILNKITVAGVEGTPVGNVVEIEVPASTDAAALDAIAYDWVSNDDAWTAANAPVATNAWEFGVTNTVTFTDKDGDESVYTITVNKAVPSSDATLSALSASAGTLAPAFDPAVLTYTVALPYGTSDVPTLSATKNHVGAAEPVIDDAAAFVNRKAVSTVTVTAEDGTTELTYTVTFNVERFPSIVIWDGSTMSAVATSPASGFTWAVTGFNSVADYNATCGAKAYTKCLPSGGGASASRNIALNVPEGYLAKFYIVFGTHSDGNNRGMFIASNAVKKLEDATSVVLTLYSSSRTNLTAGTSEFVLGAGTWYINPMESEDFYEISATLMPVGYQRTVTEGRMGTVCLPKNVEAGYIYGAEVYTLLYWKYGTSYADCQMVDFGEVEEMQAGYPYMIIPTSDKFAVVYGDETYDGDGVHMANGFTGTINPIAQADDNVLVGKYGVVNNQIRLLGPGAYSPANRAYIDLSETPSKEEYEASQTPNPAPRKRVSLGHQGEAVATGLDAINVESGKIEKVMIDGQLYIIRGGNIFDATGRLVK